MEHRDVTDVCLMIVISFSIMGFIHDEIKRELLLEVFIELKAFEFYVAYEKNKLSNPFSFQDTGVLKLLLVLYFLI